MLEWWEREMTDVVIERARTTRGGPASRLRRAAETIVRNELTRYDAAVRSWAEGDEYAAAVLERVMQKRVAYITELFLDACFSAREAKDRADLTVVYLMSEGAVHIGQTHEARLRLVRRQVKSLMS